MTDQQLVLAILIVGFFLVGIGFENRERTWSIGVLTFGVITCFSVVAYKVYVILHYVPAT